MSPPQIAVHRLNDALPVVLQVRCTRADTEVFSQVLSVGRIDADECVRPRHRQEPGRGRESADSPVLIEGCSERFAVAVVVVLRDRADQRDEIEGVGETCGRLDDQVRERPTCAHAPEKPVVQARLLRLLAPESASDQLAVVLVPLRVGYASREKGASCWR